MEASFFRSFEAVNGALFARRLRRSKTIDSLKTSEVHASMRKDGLVRDGEGRGGAGRESLAATAGRGILKVVDKFP
jgi:hypothetical protein